MPFLSYAVKNKNKDAMNICEISKGFRSYVI